MSNKKNIPTICDINILTKREHEVLSLISQGYNNSYIANELHYQDKTIEKDIVRIYRKLNLPSNTNGNTLCRVLATLRFYDIEFELIRENSFEIKDKDPLRYQTFKDRTAHLIEKFGLEGFYVRMLFFIYGELKTLSYKHPILDKKKVADILTRLEAIFDIQQIGCKKNRRTR